MRPAVATPKSIEDSRHRDTPSLEMLPTRSLRPLDHPLIVVIGLLLPAAMAPAVAQDTDSGRLMHHVDVLAADSMEGRRTATPGEARAAEYIATTLQGYGLAPAGDRGSYLQKFPVVEYVIDTEVSALSIGDTKLQFARGFRRRGGGGQFRAQSFEGDIVIVTGSPTSQVGLDLDLVEGAVVYYDAPRRDDGSVDPTWLRSVIQIAGMEPAAILLPSSLDEDGWDSVWASRESHWMATDTFGWPSWTDQKREATSLSFFEIDDDGQQALDPAIPNGDGVRTIQTDVPVDLRTVLRPNDLRYGHNVIGVVEGSDPALRDEAIVLTAHYDALGVVRSSGGDDGIVNGADDNASGVAVLLEVARSLAEDPPVRTVLFVALSGEEQGLWGSVFFLDHVPALGPTIISNVNLDMVGRTHRPGGIYAIGADELVAGAELLGPTPDGLTVLGDDEFEADFPDQHFYYRSDQISFIREGIPALFLTSSGLHDDYHSPSDEPHTVDPEHLAEVARLVHGLVRDLGSGDVTFELRRSPEEIMSEWHLRPLE